MKDSNRKEQEKKRTAIAAATDWTEATLITEATEASEALARANPPCPPPKVFPFPAGVGVGWADCWREVETVGVTRAEAEAEAEASLDKTDASLAEKEAAAEETKADMEADPVTETAFREKKSKEGKYRGFRQGSTRKGKGKTTTTLTGDVDSEGREGLLE